MSKIVAETLKLGLEEASSSFTPGLPPTVQETQGRAGRQVVAGWAFQPPTRLPTATPERPVLCDAHGAAWHQEEEALDGPQTPGRRRSPEGSQVR